VALAFADGLDVLLEQGGRVGEISVTGGGARLPYWGELLAAALNRLLTYRLGGEFGASLGAARLARLALGDRPLEDVCVALTVVRVVQLDPALAALLAARRRTFARLFQDLKNTFTEFAE
jgi:xylulokinase